jgi:hypothetical protein
MIRSAMAAVSSMKELKETTNPALSMAAWALAGFGRA